MPSSTRRIAREIGAAFAVLALYMLVLLAPLHQAAGMQRDLARLGFESSLSSSVCTSVETDQQSEAPLAAKCPLAGVGKYELAAAQLSGADLAPPLVFVQVLYPLLFGLPKHVHEGYPGRPRAPPGFV